jgi:hypothetical protein
MFEELMRVLPGIQLAPGCEPEFAARQQLRRCQDVPDLMLRLTRENLARRYRLRRPS